MITSQQIHVTFVFYFKGKEQANGFDALPSSINVVTKEKIAALWRHTSVLKQSQHVVVLSVDVPAYFDRCVEFEQHGFREEDVFDYGDEP